MIIFGLSISDWAIIFSLAGAFTWAYYNLKVGQDSAKEDIIELKRTINELKHYGTQRQEKQELNNKELKGELEKRLNNVEVELHTQANSHASTTATLSGMQINLQALTSLVHGTNSRLDTLILRTKE